MRSSPTSSSAPSSLDKWLATTRRLLAQERDEEVRGAQAALAELDDAANPNVLTQLSLAQWRTALFGRALLTLALPPAHVQRAKPHAFTVGDLVQIRLAGAAAFPTGIVARVDETSVSIALGDREELEEEQLLALSGAITIDRLVNNATFAKIDAALDRLGKFDYGPAQSVVDVVFAGKPPAWHTPLPTIAPFNDGLNASQLEAIRFALASKDLALIHGPPGTGKTTTVVEFILQAVRTFHMKVLVCAPSNIAVDNVLEKMAAAVQRQREKLTLTRVGHPARLLPQILPYCLDARIQHADGTGIVNDIRKETQHMESQLKTTRDKSERFRLRRELKANRKEIRQREHKVVAELLQHSDVVFATNVGAASKLLKDAAFDLVVIDEAAQALEASCWIPMLKAKRCVLAGDHLQLPPTIKSAAAARSGLATTLFDRVAQFEHTQAIVKMLQIQYRMHRDISDWSSRAMYKGELQSFDGVASRKLHEIAHVSVSPDDELLNATLLLIDTAGCDLEEDADDEDDGDANSLLKQSKSNAGEARVVALHVRALLAAGLRTEEVAVITPYNKQVQLLKALLLSEFPTLEIRSVDGFQGCEKEAVVMSLVRSNAGKQVGFLADERRMNVAITRAKRHVAVVCDTDTIRANAFLGKLVDHFEEHGEYRSAQEFLEADVVHGTGAGVGTAVEDEKTVKKKTAEAEASGARSGTKQQPEKKAAPSSQAKQKPSTTTASEAKAPSPISAPPAAGASATAKTTCPSVKTAEDVESDKEASGDDGGEAVETTAKPSLFDLLNASSSDDSDVEDKEEAKEGDEKDAAAEELSSATALLRDLHMSRLARQPPPPPAAAATGGKKSKSKKKKAKSTTRSSGNGSVAPVAAREDDEDDLAFLTRQADQTSRCGFQSTERRCKKSVVTLGAVCKHCNLKFCFDHAQPEVHGCGDAVRQAARQHFRTEATAKPSATAKKLSADKRKLLQKKLGDKVNEQSASRQPKPKPNAKQ